jgi:uncharacterized protein (DUF433 family)
VSATFSRKIRSILKLPQFRMSAETTTPFLWSDPQRLGGRICFRGTRVPVDSLFENLDDGIGVDEFLAAFEGVTREQVVGVLEAARRALAGAAAA